MSLFPEVSQGINNSNHLTVFMTSSVQGTTGFSAGTQFISSPTAMFLHTHAVYTEVSLTTNKNL
jgi:hypothetical protein